MKGRWRRKCPCALAWAWLAARRRARIFWAPSDTGFNFCKLDLSQVGKESWRKKRKESIEMIAGIYEFWRSGSCDARALAPFPSP
jgi:hypothetical protein